MIRLGLCCKFLEVPIRFRIATAKSLKTRRDRGEDPREHLAVLADHNITSLEAAIAWCAKAGIGAFRVGSDLLPCATHPELGYTLASLPGGEELVERLTACGVSAQKADIRLSFHPDQFVVLSSPREKVVHQALADLEHHAGLAQLLGADVINIHGGGAYGDKEAALARFRKAFRRLGPTARRCLTVENDDRVYTPADLLPLCGDLDIPLVYDVHHHRCLADDMDGEAAARAALDTWNREPLCHLSSPLEGWRGANPRRHHDYIALRDVPAPWRRLGPMTVDVEAKAKEVAVLRLGRQLAGRGWPLGSRGRLLAGRPAGTRRKP